MLPRLTRNSLSRSEISYLLPATLSVPVPITRLWRIVSSTRQKEESKGNETRVSMTKDYREEDRERTGKDLQGCKDILDVPKHPIPSAASRELKVFYHKM